MQIGSDFLDDKLKVDVMQQNNKEYMKSKMRRRGRGGIVLIILGILIMLSAAALAGYNVWDDKRASENSEKVLVQIKDIIQQNQNHSENSTSAPPATGTKPGAPATPIPDYILNPDMDLPAVEIEGRRYVGTLSIPELEVELPVLEEWSYPGLKIAPCKYVGTPYKNNFIIAAHNYDSHFGRIKELHEGDDIIFTDIDGNVFNYKVALVDTLSPYAVEEMKSGGWALTLFTCTLGGQMRVTVRCNNA